MALTFLLNIAGFIAYLVYTSARTGDWKRTTLPVAYMIEVIAIGVMIIIPLVRTEALPKTSFDFISIPIPPPPPPAVAPTPVAVHTVSTVDLEKQPPLIPKAIASFKRPPVAPSDNVGVPGGMPGGLPGGQPNGVINSIINMAGTAPAPPEPKAQPPKVIRRGGEVEQAMLIYGPKPDYPSLAQMARIQGTVRLEALIATNGTIKGLMVISGHPLLVRAALQAVEHWRYQPTLLNGQPVEVQTEIDVHFSLGN